MREWDEPSRQVGEDPPPPRLSKRPRPRQQAPADAIGDADSKRRTTSRTRVHRTPAWRSFVEFFVAEWERMVTDLRPDFRDRRVLESLNQCRTYHGAHFGELGELELEAMVTSFVTEVSQGKVRLKPGQSAWMCFTGAWGRRPSTAGVDIYAAYGVDGAR